MNDKQIKHMVDRFLRWKLPEDFTPDAGISFKPEYNENTPYPAKHEPVGTNLLTATQAEAMVRYITEGLNQLYLEELDKLKYWDEAALLDVVPVEAIKELLG